MERPWRALRDDRRTFVTATLEAMQGLVHSLSKHPESRDQVAEAISVVAAVVKSVENPNKALMADLYDPENLDVEAMARDGHAKPIIHFEGRLNVMGNMQFALEPGLPKRSHWRRFPSDYAATGQRPYNEILWIKDVKDLFYPDYVPPGRRDEGRAAIRSDLGRFIQEAVDEVVARLEVRFVVERDSRLQWVIDDPSDEADEYVGYSIEPGRLVFSTDEDRLLRAERVDAIRRARDEAKAVERALALQDRVTVPLREMAETLATMGDGRGSHGRKATYLTSCGLPCHHSNSASYVSEVREAVRALKLD